METLNVGRTVAADAPFFIVLNRGSGRNDADETSDIVRRVMEGAGRRVEFLKVGDASELANTARRAVELARAQGGVVVAAGGDGTINAVAQAVLGQGCPFGVLPQGTFNYFGRTHGISQDTEEAARALLDATISPVQVGMLNERLFLVNASLGLYPQLLEDRETYKRQYGRSRLVALWSGIMTVMRSHRRLHIDMEQDGTTRSLRTVTLFVGNNRLQLQRVGIEQSDDVHAGRLVGIALRDMSGLAMLGLLFRGAMRKLGGADDVIDFSFTQLVVKPRTGSRSRRFKVATDGEILWMEAPLVFKVAAERLPLLIPPPDQRKEEA